MTNVHQIKQTKIKMETVNIKNKTYFKILLNTIITLCTTQNFGVLAEPFSPNQIHHSQSLTDVILLNIADVAVDGGVAEDDHHHHIAVIQLDYMGGVAFHSVDLPMGWHTGELL